MHDLGERFWSKVDRSGGPDACWPWTAGRYPKGYGTYWLNGRNHGAHRLAAGLLGVPLHARHTCDNPPCCNPAHLLPGTDQNNVDDRQTRGRHWVPSGASSHAAKLTDEQVAEAKRLVLTMRQSDVAARLGVSQPAISRAVRGVTFKES